MPSPYERKTTKRIKMSSQDSSITAKSGNCETEKENISSKKNLMKLLKITKRKN